MTNEQTYNPFFEPHADPSIARERSVAELLSLGAVNVTLCTKMLQHGFVLAHEAFQARNVNQWCKVTNNLFRFARLGQIELKRVSAERAKNPGAEDVLPPADMAVVNELRNQLLHEDGGLDRLYEAARREDAGSPCPDDEQGKRDDRWATQTLRSKNSYDISGQRPEKKNRNDDAGIKQTHAFRASGDVTVDQQDSHDVESENERQSQSGPDLNRQKVSEPSASNVRESTQPEGTSDFSAVQTILVWFALWLAGSGGMLSATITLPLDTDSGSHRTARALSFGPSGSRPIHQKLAQSTFTCLSLTALEMVDDHRVDTS